MPDAIVVIPCFDEEKRLDRDRFLTFAKTPGLSLIFVDDGSRDNTLSVLNELAAASHSKIEVLAMGKNVGKGEAVRFGLKHAFAKGATIAGYADADLSTPPEELVRLIRELDDARVSVVIGARVLLIGRRVERRPMRHYLGRVFATVAQAILRLPFYDTQCGAKFFRQSELLNEVLASPFSSRWAFDVELLGRLLVGIDDHDGLTEKDILEIPLYEWIDADGSKLHFGGMAKTLLDLAKIEIELGRMRRARRAP